MTNSFLIASILNIVNENSVHWRNDLCTRVYLAFYLSIVTLRSTI